MPAPFSASITPQRVLFYGLASSFSALGVVLRAFRERSNFYSATIFLGRSNGCLLVLLNFLLFLSLCFGRLLQQIFFGPLRPMEVEHLYERSWYSLVGTLLAISIFREDFDISFVLLFGTLLFLKAFHWLSADRVEFMEQSPSVSRLFHVRMCSILSTLLFVDLFLVAFAVEVLLIKKARVGIMILFASEFMILTASLCSTIAKYGINCADLRHEEPWEAKSMWIFYVDLVHDFIRLVTHAFFFVLLTRWYGIPLSLIHDLYVTGRSCATKVRDLVRYRKATKNMESRYPDATAADLANTDGTCIICREDMLVQTERQPESGVPSGGGLNVTPKKLPCGHIFHFHCLRSWLERQQSCPTCRRTVLDEDTDSATAANRAAAPAAPAPPAPAQPTNADATVTQAPTGAEQPSFDQRLQGFIHRLQSDLARVRQEGDMSARSARHRPSSRHRTPPSHSATRTPTPTYVYLPSDATSGLWMPPPPSSLYVRGRPPTRPSAKGKEKATTVEESATTDPEDPREAIRAATLKRFGHLDTSTSSSTAAPTTSSSTATPTTSGASNAAQPQLIPLFDPAYVPEYASLHAPSLPYPLSTPHTLTAALPPEARLYDSRAAIETQIQTLTELQHRVNGVIDHLVAVLDVVDPPPSSSHA